MCGVLLLFLVLLIVFCVFVVLGVSARNGIALPLLTEVMEATVGTTVWPPRVGPPSDLGRGIPWYEMVVHGNGREDRPFLVTRS